MSALVQMVHAGFGGSSSVYPSSATNFSYTGADQNYVVGASVNKIRFRIWGAGGGSCNWYGNEAGGGSGACIAGELTVTPGETLTISVGRRGKAYPNQAGGYGGGGTGVAGSSPGGTGTNGGGGGGAASGGYGGGGGGGSAIIRSGGYLALAGGGGGASNRTMGGYGGNVSNGNGLGAGGTAPGGVGASGGQSSGPAGTTYYNGNTGTAGSRCAAANSGDFYYSTGVGVGSYSSTSSDSTGVFTDGGDGYIVIF